MTDLSPDIAAPRPAWWNSLRMRFGFLLALALLPWLLLTALGAYESVQRNRLSQTRTADLVSTGAVTEVGLILESGRLGLNAASELIADEGCEAGSAELLARLRVYDALVIQDPSGEVICRYPGQVFDLRVENADAFTPERRFRIARAEDSGRIFLQRQRRNGQVYTLVLQDGLGMIDVLEATLGDSAVIALTKPDGRRLLGDNVPKTDNATLRERVGTDRVTLMEYETVEGEARRAAVSYFRDLDIYVTVARSARGALSTLINPYTAVLLPIFAWMVGFGLIWLGTQSLLITPLAKVRGAARHYAQGKLDSRVRLSDSAAGEVHGLANTFNRMAGQLEDRDARIADNLDEKDTLLREIHHRVKNNLQIITSLLNMQERKVSSEEAIGAISETRSRINAIAAVHRGLYESDDLRSIDVSPFVTRLIGSISESLGVEQRGMTVGYEVEPCTLTADNAIPVALFIVEAVGNAVEHGLSEGGSVTVSIRKPAPAELEVRVADTGRGVADTASMRGIGTRLMQGFARQLSGELVYSDNEPGLVATLTIPLSDQDEEPFQVSRRNRPTP